MSDKLVYWIASLVVIFIIIMVIIGPQNDGQSSQKKEYTKPYESELRDELSYLKENVPEIEWMHIERNTVYLGFSSLPNDYKIICNGAALRGNQRIDFGVHLWAVSSTNNPRNSVDTYYYEVTARYGEIQ